LSEEQRREAVALLADLLLEAARKRAGVSVAFRLAIWAALPSASPTTPMGAGRRAVARDPADGKLRHKRVHP
jgi:hypothetical protein